MIRRIYFPWSVILPTVAVAILAALMLSEQLLARWSYLREIKRLASAGQPIDDVTLRASFFDSTSKTQTVDRIEVANAYNASSGLESFVELWPLHEGNLNFLGQDLVPADSDWPERPLFEYYAGRHRAILSKLESLAPDAEPTWRFWLFSNQSRTPLAWNSWETALLDAELLLAFHDGDSERALTALEVLDSTVVASDWQVNINEDLDRILADHHLYKRIIQSLREPNFWSQEQLTRLEKLVQHRTPLEQRWRSVLEGERALSLAMIDPEAGWFYATVPMHPERFPSSTGDVWIPHSMLHRFLLCLNRFVNLGEGGYAGFFNRVQNAVSQQEADLRGWFPLQPLSPPNRVPLDPMPNLRPDTDVYAQHLIILENERRLAVVTLAIRRYAMANSQWPKRIDQLADHGLSLSELHAIDGSEWVMQLDRTGDLKVECQMQILSPTVATATLRLE